MNGAGLASRPVRALCQRAGARAAGVAIPMARRFHTVPRRGMIGERARPRVSNR